MNDTELNQQGEEQESEQQGESRGLARKTTTEAVIAANRANSLKSTGPVTEAGKRNVSTNAVKHSLRGRVFRDHVRQLEKDPQEFPRFYRRWLRSIQPEDGLERSLGRMMAWNCWRVERAARAESAAIAGQRLSYDIERQRKLAGEGMGIGAAFEKLTSQDLGYSSLPDSEGKYELILFLLHNVRAEVETEGYSETGRGCLELIYGKQPGVAKKAFLLDYQALRPDPKRPPEVEAYVRQQVLGELDHEIRSFEVLRDCLRVRNGRLAEIVRDELLVPPESAKFRLEYEERVRNQLQREMKQFIEWRRFRRTMNKGERNPESDEAFE